MPLPGNTAYTEFSDNAAIAEPGHVIEQIALPLDRPQRHTAAFPKNHAPSVLADDYPGPDLPARKTPAT